MAGTNGNGQAAPPKITINSLEDLSKLHAAEMAGRQSTRQDMVRKALNLTNNLGGTDLVRGNLLNFLLDGPRDIDAECGYPPWLTPDHYRFMYDREGIARRVVDCEPEETWSMDPDLFEDDDPEKETVFEGAWNELAEQFNVWHYLSRIDVLSGIGQFGILLLMIDDGQDMREPIEGVNDDGTFDDDFVIANRSSARLGGPWKPRHRLLNIRTFDESVVFVKVREIDVNSPRYSLPKIYTVQFRDYPNWGVQAGEIIARDIHWSRVIHVADNRKMSEVYGIPRMQPVYNRLYDLRKIYSSSGEAFWKGAFPGLAFEVNPELADQGVELDTKSIREEMERFQNGTQRYLAITGVSAKSLPPEIVDPMGTAETHLKAIAIAKDIPYRVLFGSEEAVLAGNQDSRKWNKKIARRQSKYCNPMLIRPFVDRLIGMGVLPPPKQPYQIEWPDLNAPTDEDKANIASLETQAMAAYVQGGVSSLMAPREYLTHVLEYDPAQADAILEASTEFAGDEEEPLSAAGQAAMQMEAEASLMPPPGAGGSGKGDKGGKAVGGGKKGKKKQNTRPTRNAAMVDNALSDKQFEALRKAASVGHGVDQQTKVELWRLGKGQVESVPGQAGLNHHHVWSDEELSRAYGRIDHGTKKISLVGDDRSRSVAGKALARKYPDYEMVHADTGPTRNEAGLTDNATPPHEQILHNPDKGALQALFDTVHEHRLSQLPAGAEGHPAWGHQTLLRGLVDDAGGHVWGSALKHTHEDLYASSRPEYQRQNGPFQESLPGTSRVLVDAGGRIHDSSPGARPVSVPGIGSELEPVKRFVANAFETAAPENEAGLMENALDLSRHMLRNPSGGDLQALFDSVVGRHPEHVADPTTPLVRGVVSPDGKDHNWGSGVHFLHQDLANGTTNRHATGKAEALQPRVYSGFGYEIRSDGKIRTTSGRDFPVPGLPTTLKPAKRFVANASEAAAPENEVERNLVAAGHDLRAGGGGHWVLPGGKGLSPSNKRGIVNHHEAFEDAGFGPVGSHPIEANNALLKKGWLRRTGQLSYQTWGLPASHAKHIEGDLDRESYFASSPENTHAYVSVTRPDGSGEDTHHLTLADYHDAEGSLKKVVARKLDVTRSNEPVKVLPDQHPVANAWNTNPPEEYYSIGHPSRYRPANADLWALHEGKIHTADVNGGEHGLDHGYAFAPEELSTYGRIDHDQKKISMLGDERRSAYAARLLSKKYPDYSIHHFGPAGAEPVANADGVAALAPNSKFWIHGETGELHATTDPKVHHADMAGKLFGNRNVLTAIAAGHLRGAYQQPLGGSYLNGTPDSLLKHRAVVEKLFAKGIREKEPFYVDRSTSPRVGGSTISTGAKHAEFWHKLSARGDSEGMETNAANPAMQILRNPDKGMLQAFLDTVHAHNEERNYEYSPLKIVLRGAASADGSTHHWGSSFDHDHSDLKQGDSSLENHLYVTTTGQIARIGRSGGLEPHPVPGIGSKLKPVKALVANDEPRVKDASSTIMHNPDKGSLQALFDTVHHGMVMSGAINPSRPDPYDAVLRGAVSRGGERHVWGNAVRFEHEELKDAAHGINPRPELRTHVYASPDGAIWKLGPHMERQPVDVPGIGRQLKPARSMVANADYTDEERNAYLRAREVSRGILHNPTKGELQAFYDTIHLGQEHSSMRGAVDEKGNHNWGSATSHDHYNLVRGHGERTGQLAPPLSGKVTRLRVEAGKITYDRSTEPYHVPGIGSELKRNDRRDVAGGMTSNDLPVSKKHGRDQQDDANQDVDDSDLNRNPGANPDNGDASWTPNLAREGVKHPVEYEQIILPSINAEEPGEPEETEI